MVKWSYCRIKCGFDMKYKFSLDKGHFITGDFMQNCTTIKQILEMLDQGFTYEDIRAGCRIGSSVITDIKKKYEKMGISLNQLKLISPEEVSWKFYPAIRRREERPLPDFKEVYLKITGK